MCTAPFTSYTINNSSSFVLANIMMMWLMMLISTVNILKYIFKADKREPHLFYVCIVSLCFVDTHCNRAALPHCVICRMLLFNVKIMFLSTVFTSTISYKHSNIECYAVTIHFTSLLFIACLQALFADK